MSQLPPQQPPDRPLPGAAPPGGWTIPPGPGGPPPEDLTRQSWGQGDPDGRPPRRSTIPLMIVLAVLAAVVVGGGIVALTRDGDKRTEEEQAYIDALADFTEAQQADDLDFSAEESRCFAEAIVDAVGVDGLQAVASPAEIRTGSEAIQVDRRQAEAIYDDSSDCIDYRQILLNNARQEAMPAAQIECLDRILTEDLARNFLVAQLAGDAEAMEEPGRALAEAAAPCDNAG